jgi:hypothetical protein
MSSSRSIRFLKASKDRAHGLCYFDDLMRGPYPITPSSPRHVDHEQFSEFQSVLQASVSHESNVKVVQHAIGFEKSAIEDPYLSMLRMWPEQIDRNQSATARVASLLREVERRGELGRRLSEPKVANRQFGGKLRDWLYDQNPLGLPLLSEEEFVSTTDNAILQGSDHVIATVAARLVDYSRSKLPDCLIRVNKQLLVGEAKLITNKGGNQNNQLRDAFGLLDENCNCIKFAVLDGIVYNDNAFLKKMEERVVGGQYILSALLLRDWLFQV